jgi:hypothetical protein
MVDTETGKSRGYGFVNMPQYDSAFEAVRLMHGVQVAPGKNLSVSFKTNKRNSHKYPSSSSVKSWSWILLVDFDSVDDIHATVTRPLCKSVVQVMVVIYLYRVGCQIVVIVAIDSQLWLTVQWLE